MDGRCSCFDIFKYLILLNRSIFLIMGHDADVVFTCNGASLIREVMVTIFWPLFRWNFMWFGLNLKRGHIDIYTPPPLQREIAKFEFLQNKATILYCGGSDSPQLLPQIQKQAKIVVRMKWPISRYNDQSRQDNFFNKTDRLEELKEYPKGIIWFFPTSINIIRGLYRKNKNLTELKLEPAKTALLQKKKPSLPKQPL